MPEKNTKQIPKASECRTCGSSRTYTEHPLEELGKITIYSCDECSAIFWSIQKWFVAKGSFTPTYKAQS